MWTYDDAPEKTLLVSKKFKNLWLEYLTNGKYKRAKGVLIDPTTSKQRCCLGVAFAAAKKLGLTKARRPDCNGLLEPDELKLIGLGWRQQAALARANDSMEIPKGMYYPKEVIDIIKKFRVKTRTKKK